MQWKAAVLQGFVAPATDFESSEVPLDCPVPPVTAFRDFFLFGGKRSASPRRQKKSVLVGTRAWRKIERHLNLVPKQMSVNESATGHAEA